MKAKIKVTTGAVIIESIYVVYRSKDCLALSIDCKSKYPECYDGEDADGRKMLFLGRGPRTLGFNPRKDYPAEILVSLGGSLWKSAYEVGRYSVFWVLVRYPTDDERELVYDRVRKVKKSPRKQPKKV